MKTNILLFFSAIILLAGCLIHECGRDEPQLDYAPEIRIDTLVYVDTVRYYKPVARDCTVIRYLSVRVPIDPGMKCPGTVNAYAEGDSSLRSEHDEDSADVVLPVVLREYADSTYRAWVSGPVDPSLDSIEVYPRREVVTIREVVIPDKGKRWGIGPSVGIGYTQAGWQPYAGVSVTYNLWQF